MFRRIAMVSLFLTLPVFAVMALTSCKTNDAVRIRDIGSQEAGRIVHDTVKNYFMQNKNATLSYNTTLESGLYKVNIGMGKVPHDFYLTPDGERIIFPDGIIAISEIKDRAQKTASTQEIPKRDKPLIELYVMSLCPYGLKAEKKILPLMDYFCDSADFKIKYIVKARGNTIEEIESLHGIDEVKENLRQLAILRYQADKFPDYLEKIDKGICLLSCGAARLDDYWKTAAKEAGINVEQVESFAYGPEAMALLRQDSEDATKYNISGSPTLLINGVRSDAIYADNNAIKKDICSAFSNLPALCKDYAGSAN